MSTFFSCKIIIINICFFFLQQFARLIVIMDDYFAWCWISTVGESHSAVWKLQFSFYFLKILYTLQYSVTPFSPI